MGFLRRARRIALALCAVSVAVPVAAGADSASSGTTYFASASSTASSPCSEAAPCRLDYAVGAAGTGDVVVVLPGTYSVSYPVSSAKAITIEGQPDQPRPSLVGTSGLKNDTLSLTGGATVRHLDIQTNSTAHQQASALSIEGGLAEDLILSAGPQDLHGQALSVNDSSSGTLVRTVLATSKAPGGSVVSLQDGTSPGTASFYNLTAVANGGANTDVSGAMSQGTALIKDSILTGGSKPITASSNTNSIQVQSSDFSASGSTGYTDGGGNISAAPVFADAANGDYHEASSSPTIDAGAADASLSALDLDGNSRSTGAAPDMGAYEFVPSPATTTTTTTTTTSSTPHPQLGVSVSIGPVSGSVSIKTPGSDSFTLLAGGGSVPVGSVIDATKGEVALTTADGAGGTQTGLFRGGQFEVGQSATGGGRTVLRLLGGSFAGCRSHHLSHDLMARAARHPKRTRHRVVRQLWGSDNGGKFVTVGSTASAAVRGTQWLTQDRCDGTLVKVLKGHVVVRDRAHHHHVTLSPGQSYLARARS